MMFDNVRRELPAREVYTSFGVQSFLLAFNGVNLTTNYVADLSLQPLKRSSWYHMTQLPHPKSHCWWLKASTLNHIVTIWLAQGPQLNKDTFIRQAFQEFRD